MNQLVMLKMVYVLRGFKTALALTGTWKCGGVVAVCVRQDVGQKWEDTYGGSARMTMTRNDL